MPEVSGQPAVNLMPMGHAAFQQQQQQPVYAIHQQQQQQPVYMGGQSGMLPMQTMTMQQQPVNHQMFAQQQMYPQQQYGQVSLVWLKLVYVLLQTQIGTDFSLLRE